MAANKKNTSKMKKRPQFKGHYCKICDTYKANEKFSGKGHNAHICKSCAAKSPAQQAEEMTINKLYRMAGRFISKDEIKWLENRKNDKRPEVRELAEQIYNEKFPHHARNKIKKTLKINKLLFHIRSEMLDEYGDEYFANIKYIVDKSGKIVRESFDENDVFIEEKVVEIGQSTICKLFNTAVHNYNIYFWDTDLCREISYDPNIDLLPEYWDDDFDYDDSEIDEEPEQIELENDLEHDDSVPTWNVEVTYTNGAIQNTKGYDIIPHEVEFLFSDFESYFEDEFPDFDEDDIAINDGL